MIVPSRDLENFIVALSRVQRMKPEAEAARRGAEVAGARAQVTVVRRTGRLAQSKRVQIRPPRAALSFEQPYAHKIDDRTKFFARAVEESEEAMTREATRELDPMITVEDWFGG